MPPGARKPKRPKPNAVVIEMLERWLAHARDGLVQQVFVLAQLPDDEWTDDYCVDDHETLLAELRSARLRVEADMRAAPDTVH